MRLKVDRLVIASKGSFLERLRQRRMGMACAGNVQACGSDHLTGIRANNVHTQHTIRFLLDNKLNEAVRFVIGLGTRVRHEGELAHLVLNTFCLQRLFRLADPRHLWVRVDHRWDHIVVYVAVAGSNDLGGRNTFVLSLVREHRTKGRIANTLHALAPVSYTHLTLPTKA